MKSALAAAAFGALCAGGVSRAQVFEFSAGASTAFDAQGGALVIHGANSETTLGAGFSEGRFAAGGATTRKYGGGLLTAGQQQLRLDVPTDVFDTGHTFSGVGIGYHRAIGAGTGLELFAGQSSLDGGTPLFHAEETTGVAVAAQFQGKLNDRCQVVSTAVVASAVALLESAQCTPVKGLTAAVTAGLGSGAAYLAASVHFEARDLKLRAAYIAASPSFSRNVNQAQIVPEPIGANLAGSYRLSHGWTLSGLHERFLTAASPTEEITQPEQHSSVDDLSLGYQRHGNGFSITALRSSFEQAASPVANAFSGRNLGVTLAAERQIGPVQVTEALFESRNASTLNPGRASWSSLLVTTLSTRINAHLRLDETVNISGGQATFAHGGELLTARSSFRVDYEMFYSPVQPQHPFQQAMVFSAEMRLLRRLAVSAESSIDPLGHTVYTFSLGSQLARHGMGGTQNAGGVSLYTVQGRVFDPQGEPMEGAALAIGTHHLYTDSTGWFQFRESRAAVHPLRVLTEEFLHVGSFATVEAPQSVMSAAPREGGSRELRIVVARVVAP